MILAVAELLSCIYVGLSIVAQYSADDGSDSSRCMRRCSILTFIWLIADAFAFIVQGPVLGSNIPMYAANFVAYSFGSVVLFFYLNYVDTFIREQTTLHPLAFKIPMLVDIVCFGFTTYMFMIGKIVVFDSGAPVSIDESPPAIVVLLLLLVYCTLIPYLKRKEIGNKAVVLIAAYTFLPASAIALTPVTKYDLSVLATAFAITLVAELLQKETIRKRRREAEKANMRLGLAAKHDKFMADALDFILKVETLDAFIDFISGRLLDIYGCDQVIYQDIDKRTIVKSRPGSQHVDAEIGKEDPQHPFNATLTKNDLANHDDTQADFGESPRHNGDYAKSSISRNITINNGTFGQLSLIYLRETHIFNEEENSTFSSLAQMLTLVITREAHRKEIEESLIFTNYFLDTFVSSYSVNLDTREFSVYKRVDRLSKHYPVISDYVKSMLDYIGKDVHPEDREALTQFIQPENLKERLKNNLVVTHSFRDISEGVEKLFGLRVVRGANEHSVAFAFVDYSETARIEQERQEQRHLKSFGDMLNAATWSIDIDKDDEIVGTRWSDEYKHMLGYDKEFTFPDPKMKWFDCIHPEDRERVVNHINNAIKSKIEDMVCNVEFRIRRQDGKYHWYHSYGRIENNANNTRRMYGIITDISTEKELAVKNARFEALKSIFNADLWSFRLNARDKIVGEEHSEHLAQLLDITNIADQGLNILKTLIHPDDFKSTTDAFNATIADHSGNTPFDVIFRMIDKLGNYNWYHSAGSVIRQKDGSGEFFGIMLNINKTIEKEHEQQKKLDEAKAIERANQAKSYFFSMVSHDIRTPLNAIIGYAELLKLGMASEDEKLNAVDSVLVSGRTLLNLINDVLDLSKLEAGKMDILPEPVDATRLVRDVAEAFKATIRTKPVEIKLDLAPMPWLKFDPHRMRQILFNIIGNAVKFTDRGHIEVKTEYIPDSNGDNSGNGMPEHRGTFRFSVIDTGCGISNEDLKRIATPYVQVGIKAARNNGTGLGLAICKQLIAKMNGKIEFKSILGAGTTVSVEVPDIEEEVSKHDELASPTNREETPPGIESALELRVLVVDDVPMNRMVLKTMLKKLGFANIETADNGFDALKKMKEVETGGENAIGLILTDMWMPGLDGEKLLKEIRKNHAWDNIPVYAVTADIEAQKTFADMGFAGILLKPLTMEKLKEFCQSLKIS